MPAEKLISPSRRRRARQRSRSLCSVTCHSLSSLCLPCVEFDIRSSFCSSPSISHFSRIFHGIFVSLQSLSLFLIGQPVYRTYRKVRQIHSYGSSFSSSHSSSSSSLLLRANRDSRIGWVGRNGVRMVLVVLSCFVVVLFLF